LRVLIKYYGFDTITGENIGAAKSGWTCTYDGDALFSWGDFRQVRAPSLSDSSICDVLFDVADSDGAKFIVKGAGTFTEPVLWTDSATDLGQGIGLMNQVCRFHDTSLLGEFEPVRDVIMQWTFPLTIGVTAVKATVCLLFHLILGVRLIDLDKLSRTLRHWVLNGIDPIYFDKLKIIAHWLLPHAL